eukprot:10307883-Karenia_brevis.AAC.1
MNGIRTVRLVRALVEMFESASGQVVHKLKSTFIACRKLTSTERRALSDAWPGSVLVDRQVVLGTQLGHGVTVSDFFAVP